MTDVAVALLKCDKPALGGDTSNRLAQFGITVSQAKAMLSRVHSNLKVVVAPEYFYSPIEEIGQVHKQDGPVAITRKKKHEIYDDLIKISKQNNGVIIVAGSIYYKKGKGGKSKGLNVCPVLYNGEIIHKYYKKMDDGALNKDLVDATFSHKDSDPVFRIGGVNFGIEICGDHNQGVNNLKSWLAVNNKPPVAIQILISDGNFPQPARMVAKPNGYFVHCDLNGGSGGSLGVYKSDDNGVFKSGIANSLKPKISFVSGPNLGVSIYSLPNV